MDQLARAAVTQLAPLPDDDALAIRRQTLAFDIVIIYGINASSVHRSRVSRRSRTKPVSRVARHSRHGDEGISGSNMATSEITSTSVVEFTKLECILVLDTACTSEHPVGKSCCSGDKGSQRKDVKRAQEFFRGYLEELNLGKA